MNIQQYLMANTRFYPVDVFIPEDCALCEVEGSEHLVHIVMDDGRASIEDFE